MQKRCFFCAVLFCALAAAGAQVSVDPGDPFYLTAQAWEIQGLVSPLPQLRPYPANAIRRIIDEVIAAGTDEDGAVIPQYAREVACAKDEYERIFSRPYHVSVAVGGTLRAESDVTNDDTALRKQFEGEVAAEGDVVLPFTRIVTAGYHFGIWGTTTEYANVAQRYVNQGQDSVYDAATVGPVDGYLNVNCNIALGTDRYYATGGIHRVGYGPFLGDGLALNDTAYHAANVTLNVSRPRWDFTTLYEIIGASNNLGEELSDSKYLAFHALRLNITPKFLLSYYESLVMGPQSTLLYALPAPYMAIQNLGGAGANLQMGLLFEYKPVRTLKLAADIFVDDIDIQEVAKLNFDSRIRLAGQVGATYTPLNSPLTLMSFSYQIVLPYVYAHWEYDSESSGYVSGMSWNYQNYTNNGICMGASIPPDSDKVSFFARFNPISRLQLDVNANFIRHQNVAESFSDNDKVHYMLAEAEQYRTDGSVFTHQQFAQGEDVDAAWYHLSFMSGAHSMLVCQFAVAGQYTFPRVLKGRLSVKLGYALEYIHNDGVQNDIYPGKKADYADYFDGDGKLRDDFDRDKVLQDANVAYEKWVKQLTDKVNHFVTLSVKYTY